MNNKTCGECKSFPGMGYYCPIIGRFCDPNNEKPCEFFEKPMGRIATNGDRVRQMSNEELIKFKERAWCFYCAYHVNGGGRFTENCNKPTGKICADGTKEWLNAPAESEESEGEDE